MGVCGREVIELAVPPPDILDCGRRMPVLAAIVVIGPVLRDGEVARATAEAGGRKAVGAGTDTRRFSFNLFVSAAF